MSKGYFTVEKETENIIVIERSKFICSIKPVNDEVEAKNFIENIKKKHSLATHNCYAYIADDKGLIQKFSDDGEPQGTAGLPMLEVLKNKKMYKTVAVVTRYFGGIKLGTGGLTKAYGGSVANCLNVCKILQMEDAIIYKVERDYDSYSKLLKVLDNKNVSIIETEFLNSVSVKFAVKKEYDDLLKNKLVDVFNGKIEILPLENKYCAF
jgi:uncharacterized YigZ family protein